jgi:hypothetical protein
VIATSDDALEWCEDQILSRGAERGDLRGEGSRPISPSARFRENKEGDSSSLQALRRILREHLEIEEEKEDISGQSPQSLLGNSCAILSHTELCYALL